MGKHIAYSSFQIRLRLIAFVLFLGFSLFYFGLVLWNFQFSFLPYLFLAFFFALLTVDFLSGFIHWAADTWGTVELPIVGKSIIQSFRLHHSDQKGITRHNFLETNGDVAIVAVIVQVFGFFLLQSFAFHYFILCYFAFLTTVGQMTNQIHKWAHQDKAPKFISFLQRYHLILSPEHHGTHHTAPHENYYCITFGWLNPFFTAIGFFPFLEKIISFFIGLTPRAEIVRKKKMIRISLSKV